MVRQFNYFVLIMSVCLFSACFKLDSLLFNASDNITEYLLDDYQGETDIKVGNTFHIPDSLIHLFAISSLSSGEPAFLQTLFIGNLNTIHKDTIIIYCHGNRDHLDFYWPRIKLLANTGGLGRFSVISIDYRGFGLTGGTTTEQSLYDDIEALITWLNNMGVSNNKMVLYGFSLGSLPAVYHAGKSRNITPGRLILEAPIGSVELMVQTSAALSLPASYFVNLKGNNVEQIKDVYVPFLWLHGTADNFLALETQGQPVFDTYLGPFKKHISVQGAVHNNVPYVYGYEQYLNTILEFIEKPE